MSFLRRIGTGYILASYVVALVGVGVVVADEAWLLADVENAVTMVAVVLFAPFSVALFLGVFGLPHLVHRLGTEPSTALDPPDLVMSLLLLAVTWTVFSLAAPRLLAAARGRHPAAPRDPGLSRRMLALWRDSGAAGDPHPDLDDLLARWSEPHRAYHGLAHLRHCLSELDTARHLAHDASIVELALWYHDAVHEPLAKDNEERSAGLADAAAARMGLAPARREALRAFILATKHQQAPAPGDEALVVDIDLAILGQPPERFDEYERGIRQEYALVPEPLFREGRARILRALLDRPRLYATDEFRDRYESSARANLRRALSA